MYTGSFMMAGCTHRELCSMYQSLPIYALTNGIPRTAAIRKFGRIFKRF